MRQRDNASQNRRQNSSNKGKFIKQEIQPDFEHIMSLFDKMKEQFQREINERYRNNVVLAGYDAQNEYNNNNPGSNQNLSKNGSNEANKGPSGNSNQSFLLQRNNNNNNGMNNSINSPLVTPNGGSSGESNNGRGVGGDTPQEQFA